MNQLENKTVRLPEGWDKFEEVKKIISEKGSARVYFVAVSCSGRPGAREARKMQKWLEKRDIGTVKSFAQLVYLRDSGYDSRGNREIDFKIPAIKCEVKTPEEFAEMWWSLQAIPNSSCGCSIMVSDSQSTDVRVMDMEHIAYGEIRA